MSDLTEEVKGQVAAVEASLAQADMFFKTLDKVEYDEVTTQLIPEDRARYDLTVLYAINSLFWMLKRSNGEDPQNHGIKGEMDRIKERMVQLKAIKDKANMPRVNKAAAERVVRHELNMQRKRRRVTRAEQEDNWENEQMETKEQDDNNITNNTQVNQRTTSKSTKETLV